jgi:anti-sigma B factor antagonist
MELRIDRHDDFHIIHLEGRMSADAVEPARSAIEAIIEGGGRALVFDMLKLEFLCSAGLGVFVQVVRDFKVLGGRVRFCRLREEVRQVFDITGLSLRLETYPTLAEALAGPGAPGRA